MDGVDAALLELSDDGFLLADLGYAALDYTREDKLLLKRMESCVRSAKGDLTLARIEFVQDTDTGLTLDDVIRRSTDLHIACVKKLLQKTGCQSSDIAIVGYHGQTVYHSPSAKITLSLGDPQYMANELGINVIHDFRREDVAAGGQGAPFAPLYHYALAKRDHVLPLGIINCGGIANVTLIPSQDEADMIAFDTGPGNGLIDLVVRQRTDGHESMDYDGIYGLQGVVNKNALKALHDKSLVRNGQNYLGQLPPKSLDIGDMKLVSEIDALNLNDACATLESFTAKTIVDGLRLVSESVILPKRWILCGGGWKNPVIRNMFEDELRSYLGDDVIVQTADAAGWKSQAIEAQIFAYLAVRSLQGKPLSLPNTTGVPVPLTGGSFFRCH